MSILRIHPDLLNKHVYKAIKWINQVIPTSDAQTLLIGACVFIEYISNTILLEYELDISYTNVVMPSSK